MMKRVVRVEEYSASERTAEARVVFLEGRDEELDHLVVLRTHTHTNTHTQTHTHTHQG